MKKSKTMQFNIGDMFDYMVKSKNTTRKEVAIHKRTSDAKVVESNSDFTEKHARINLNAVDLNLNTFIVAKKNKKKKLSPLKRRVVNERIKFLQSKGIILTSDTPTQANRVIDQRNCIVLSNFATMDEISDEDEKNELFSNIYQLCSPFGEVVKINIVDRETDSSGNASLALEGGVDILVEMKTKEMAILTLSKLSGLVVAGEPLRVSMRLQEGDDVTPAVMGTGGDGQAQAPGKGAEASDVYPRNEPFPFHGEAESYFVVRLMNAVFASDIEEPDETEEVLSDLCSIASMSGIPSHIYITAQEAREAQEASTVKEVSPAIGPVCWVGLGPQVRSSKLGLGPGVGGGGAVCEAAVPEYPWGLVWVSDRGGLRGVLHLASAVVGRRVAGRAMDVRFVDYCVDAFEVPASSNCVGVTVSSLVTMVQSGDADKDIFGLRIVGASLSACCRLAEEMGTSAQDVWISETLRYLIELSLRIEASRVKYEAILRLIEVLSDHSSGDLKSSNDPLPVSYSVRVVFQGRHGESGESSHFEWPILFGFTLDECELYLGIFEEFCFRNISQGSTAFAFPLCSRVEVVVIDTSTSPFSTEVSPRHVTLFVTGQGSLLSVHNFLENSDIEDVQGPFFAEELTSMKRDMVSLFIDIESIDNTPSSAYIRNAAIISPMTNMLVPSTHSGRSNCGIFAHSLAVEMSFVKYAEAFEAMAALHSTKIGGNVVHAVIENAKVLKSDIPARLQASLAHMAHKHVPTGSAGKMSDGHTSIGLTGTGGKERSLAVSSTDTFTAVSSKLPKHSSPSQPIAVITDEHLLAHVKDMLTVLSELQQRAKEKDPLNAKKKERFVLGMKQVTNCIKSGRAKLVLLAPDTETSDAIDSKLDVLVQLAKERGIPCVYCMRRRQLGKAVGSTMKQAAVAVVNAEGAHDHYKKIIHFINTGEIKHS